MTSGFTPLHGDVGSLGGLAGKLGTGSALLPLKSKWRLVNGCNARSSNSSLSNCESLGPVDRRNHRDDGDRQPAICVDSFHQAHPGAPARLTCGGAVDIYPVYFSGKLGCFVLMKFCPHHRSALDAWDRLVISWAPVGSVPVSPAP